MNIKHRDQMLLQAAEGWLGLGDYVSADEELDQITAESRGHPEVLKIRCEILAAGKKWEAAADIARRVSQLEPGNPFGFVRCAFALHEMKRTDEALEILLPVVDKFPGEWVMPYNLACYSCQLRDLTAAWKWLERALEVAGKKDVLALALTDLDLEALWTEIRQI